MYRFVVTAAVVALLVSGCGSAEEKSGSTSASAPSASSSPEPTYFQQAESDEMNKTAAGAQRAAVAAIDTKNVDRCARIERYPAWRRCLHKLLDPLALGLTEVSAAFTALSARPFPEKCVTQLEGAARSFTSYSETVAALLTGFDSDRKAAQTKAANTYGSTLDELAENFAKPFQKVTGACYSPEVLASLKASPSPSASPGQ